MEEENRSFIYSQLHIDVVRNALDDFNLFHNKNRWHEIHNNPFSGPIVLGFQIESLIENEIRLYRLLHGEEHLIAENNLRFSNFQFSFASVIKPEQKVTIDIKKSQLKLGPNTILSNRVSVRSARKISLLGYVKESQTALFLPNANLSHLGELKQVPDCTYLLDSSFFLKRKYMNTSNAKNFLSGSLAEQDSYFDELDGKICFPQIYPCGLISSALLEKAIREDLDLRRNPMVYTSHKISIDRTQQVRIRSNDALHILVRFRPEDSNGGELGKAVNTQHEQNYECYGVLNEQAILYRALISLAPLKKLLNSLSK